MINSENIDPREVLMHLKAMGFNHVTPHQLKEFIHDLKKLIKYEQSQQHKTESLSSRESECECSCAEYEDSYNSTNSENNISSYDTSSTYDQQSSSKSNSSKSDDTLPKTRLQLEYELSQKFQASFIKPWNLRIGKEASSNTRKHFDPVRLYHHYKEIWARQGVPGENKHSQLCWFVRNKMMGQEPSPRMLTGSNKGFMS